MNNARRIERRFGVAVLIVAWLIPAVALGAERAEEVFSLAARYTVKIETTVSLPLHSDDEAGVFTGAGFVVDGERGWIVTNAHVVSRSPATLRLRTVDGPWIAARRVYVDPYLDIAVIAPTEPGKLAGAMTADLACDGIPPVGHPVGAFGHPWDLDFTGTRGIVAGVAERYEPGALLTDAPINDGNSGGPLVSLVTGKVIGVNTSGLEAKAVQNLNFAISAHYVCRIIELLRVGHDPSPLARSLVFYADSAQTGTVKVARNFMPAGSLPLRPGDVIKEVVGNSGPIARETDLIHALRGRLDSVTLRIARDGRDIVLSGRLPATSRVLERKAVYASGVVFGQARSFDPAEINYSPIAACYIEDGSLGMSAGFERCDAVETVGGVPTTDLDQIYRQLETARRAGKSITVAVKRIAGLQGKSFFEYRELSLPIEDLHWMGVEDQRVEATGGNPSFVHQIPGPAMGLREKAGEPARHRIGGGDRQPRLYLARAALQGYGTASGQRLQECARGALRVSSASAARPAVGKHGFRSTNYFRGARQ